MAPSSHGVRTRNTASRRNRMTEPPTPRSTALHNFSKYFGSITATMTPANEPVADRNGQDALINHTLPVGLSAGAPM